MRRMQSFREYMANATQPGETNIDPVRLKVVDQYINNTILPSLTPQDNAKYKAVINSPMSKDFYTQIAKDGYNVGKIQPVLRKLMNDPRVAQISQYNLNPDQQQSSSSSASSNSSTSSTSSTPSNQSTQSNQQNQNSSPFSQPTTPA